MLDLVVVDDGWLLDRLWHLLLVRVHLVHVHHVPHVVWHGAVLLLAWLLLGLLHHLVLFHANGVLHVLLLLSLLLSHGHLVLLLLIRVLLIHLAGWQLHLLVGWIPLLLLEILNLT